MIPLNFKITMFEYTLKAALDLLKTNYIGNQGMVIHLQPKLNFKLKPILYWTLLYYFHGFFASGVGSCVFSKVGFRILHILTLFATIYILIINMPVLSYSWLVICAFKLTINDFLTETEMDHRQLKFKVFGFLIEICYWLFTLRSAKNLTGISRYKYLFGQLWRWE